jgi:hypothetical protein
LRCVRCSGPPKRSGANKQLVKWLWRCHLFFSGLPGFRLSLLYSNLSLEPFDSSEGDGYHGLTQKEFNRNPPSALRPALHSPMTPTAPKFAIVQLEWGTLVGFGKPIFWKMGMGMGRGLQSTGQQSNDLPISIILVARPPVVPTRTWVCFSNSHAPHSHRNVRCVHFTIFE